MQYVRSILEQQNNVLDVIFVLYYSVRSPL